METSESSLEKSSSLKEESTRFRLLYEAGKQLGQIVDPSQLEEAYDVVIRLLEENSESQAVIRRFNAETGQLVLARVGQQCEIPQVQAIEAVPSLRKTLIFADNPELLHPVSKSLVVTPIEFKDDFYGILALSYEKEVRFTDEEVQLLQALAQQLAITIHRLVTVRSQQELEKRASETRMLNLIGKASFDLTHRLGNQLPLIRLRLKKLKDELAIQRDTRLLKSIDMALHSTDRSLTDITSFRNSVMELRDLTIEEPTVIPVSALLEEATRLLPVIPDNVQFNCQKYNEDTRVRIVPKQILNALYNLMANAIEAMPNGGELTLEARSKDKHVEIEIADSGIGIAAEDRDKIFDLFFSTKHSSGFGLWSARLNTKYNGGELLVASELGKGTSFTIKLPQEP